MSKHSNKNLFSALIEYFIHPSLKIEKSVYEKSKISIVVFLLSFLMVTIYSLYYTSKGFYTDVKALHNYLGVFILLLSLIMVKFSGKVDIALSSVAYFSVYLVGSSIYLSGGLKSNDVQWFFVIMASAFMFISARDGIGITICVLLAMAFFYYLEVNHLNHEATNELSLSIDYKFFNYLLVLVLLASMFFILVKGNQRLQVIIQKSKEQEIRVEIARDFHDQIGNKLASLQHLTEMIKLKKTEMEKEAILSKIDNNAKEVYDNFRDFIWTLDAKSDSVLELFMYLRDFADDYFRFSDVNIYTNSTPENLPNIILPGRISKEIVPIFKEAITNITKHAKAKNVHLSFELTKDEFSIILKDDGLGFDIEQVAKGKGLNNIQHRSSRTGGNLTIFSNANQGTEIKLTVKLPEKGSGLSLGNA